MNTLGLFIAALGIIVFVLVSSRLLYNKNISSNRFAWITSSLFSGVFLVILFAAIGIDTRSLIVGAILTTTNLGIGFSVFRSFYRRYWSKQE